MNSEKVLKKYVGISGARKFFTWLFLIALLATLPMWTVFKKTADPSTAVRFDAISEENGEYVYLDIVGVSDWVYKYTHRHTTTTYYSAEDPDGYLYMIELSNSDFNKMTAQQEYWNRTDDNAPMPEPYRVYGQAQKTPSDKLNDFAEVWEVSTEEFVEYFGDRYIDVGSSSENTSNIAWAMGSLFSGIFFLILGSENRKVKKTMKYCLNLLASKGELDQAAAELSDGNAVIIGDDMARASANYLFGKKTGCILRYDDIVYCYPDILVASSRRSVKGFFNVNTKDKKHINAANLGTAYTTYGAQLEAIVSEHNPNVLTGNTRDNDAAYKELCRK